MRRQGHLWRKAVKSQWRFGVHVPRWAVVCGLMMGAVGWTAEADALSGRATVKRDGVSLSAQMATTSEVLSVLARDAIVQVDFAILNAQGHWCRVTEVASPRSAGYVRCEDLEPLASDLVREGRTLSQESAKKLEETVKSDPSDLSARARLLGYYFFTSLPSAGRVPTLQARRRHILWIIQNRPDADIGGFPEATLDPTGHPLADKEGYNRARQLWLQQVETYKGNSSVLGHAAKFLQLHDKEIAEGLLKRGQALHPNDPSWSMRLGYLYALGILGVNGLNQTGIPTSVDPSAAQGGFAKKARKELGASRDVVVLGTAGSILFQYGSMLRAMPKIKSDYHAVAEEILKRGEALEPNNPAWSAMLGELYKLDTLTSRSPAGKAASAKKALEQFEKSASMLGDKPDGLSALENLAKTSFEAGEVEKAKAYARKLLDTASQRKEDGMYGTAIHHGNLILGRVALKEGDTQKAKTFLLKAGQTPGGGTLSSFGPNMALAKELLEEDERETVIKYLELCKNFWDYNKGLLERWIQTTKSGETPQFGPNLIY